VKRRIRCACVAADGQQCGRTVTDGSQPPICHIHRNKANGTLAGIAQPKTRTPKEIIEKLLTDSDPSVRLRAVEMWQKHFEHKEQSDNGQYHELLRLMIEDERDHLKACLDTIADLKEQVYDRNPDLEPDAITLDRRARRDAAALSRMKAANAAKPVTLPQPPVVVEESDDTDDFDLVSREDFDAEP
jgi:hypothetical protein